jgi:hypothetical protein
VLLPSYCYHDALQVAQVIKVFNICNSAILNAYLNSGTYTRSLWEALRSLRTFEAGR